MTPEQAKFPDVSDRASQLDRIGWGVFLVMLGTIWLVPRVPPGTWLIGTGILLMALNALRSWLGIPWSGFWVSVGVIALAAGLGDFVGIKLPLFPICLVILGVALIVRPLISQKT